ncbi:hypothetical protein HZ99_13950 [Pseudomonas fluorescens]|nr:hypothetical protein HZ99_13950 [Pseudomonas fluorescens]MBF4558927.1 inovirus-type Gp2 protein [Pseudomonas sp. p50(2008)]
MPRVNRVFKDKQGGLVVGYIGISNELKSALKEYTASKSNPYYHLHRDDLARQADFFYRARYLCKSATKIFGNGSHSFGCSRS